MMKVVDVKRANSLIETRAFFVEMRNELSRRSSSNIWLVFDDTSSAVGPAPSLSFSASWGLSRPVVERMIERELELANAELKKLRVED